MRQQQREDEANALAVDDSRMSAIWTFNPSGAHSIEHVATLSLHLIDP